MQLTAADFLPFLFEVLDTFIFNAIVSHYGYQVIKAPMVIAITNGFEISFHTSSEIYALKI